MRAFTKILVLAAAAVAAPATAQPPADQPAENLKEAEFAPRTTLSGQVELARLVDLCAQRLKLNIDYDAAALKGTVTLRLDAPLSDEDLWLLTNRVLAARGFTTVRVPGNAAYSVVKLSDAPGLAAAGAVRQAEPAPLPGLEPAARSVEPPAGYRAVVVRSQHRAGKDLVEPISKVLSRSGGGAGAGGSVSVVGDGSLLLITDLADRVERALELLAQLDQAAASVSIVEVPLTNLSGVQMAALLGQVAAKREAAGGGRLAGELMAAPEPGSVLVVAPESQLDAWRELISSLDKRERPETVTYVPRVFSPKDVAKLIEQTIKGGVGGAGGSGGIFSPGGPGGGGGGMLSGSGAGGDDRWKLVIDDLTSSLVITATPAQHEAIRALLFRLDSVPAAARRPVRTFVVKNRPVQEVLDVLERLLSAGVLEAAGSEGAPDAAGTLQGGTNIYDPAGSAASAGSGITLNTRGGGSGGAGGGAVASDNAGAARTTPMPPPPAASRSGGSAAGPLLPFASSSGDSVARGGYTTDANSAGSSSSAFGTAERPLVLTSDEGTNTLIAVGEPRLLDRVEALLRTIDVRQPQVMLEVLMVTVNESQALDLGVELEKLRLSPDLAIRLSSLFGLGVRGAGGDRNAGDASGGTGVIVSPGDFSIVFRLLQTLSDGRALSMPKVLVGNNQAATINSVVQQPFASVNASNTVSTTSFGGTQDAGTVVTIKPQIAEGDHLLLTYSVSLSSFLGAASSPTLPPARQQNSVQSVATIPDGYTVVVGGIEVENEGKATSQVPFLGDIPIIGEAFKSRSNTASKSKFFVFIRANVLRGAGRGFEDLKYLSDRDVARAGIDDGWPEMKPRVIR
ncbi:MAG: secretin N-terminal domain-containing protein [Phycisphaerales bacterium]